MLTQFIIAASLFSQTGYVECSDIQVLINADLSQQMVFVPVKLRTSGYCAYIPVIGGYLPGIKEFHKGDVVELHLNYSSEDRTKYIPQYGVIEYDRPQDSPKSIPSPSPPTGQEKETKAVEPTPKVESSTKKKGDSLSSHLKKPSDVR